MGKLLSQVRCLNGYPVMWGFYNMGGSKLTSLSAIRTSLVVSDATLVQSISQLVAQLGKMSSGGNDGELLSWICMKQGMYLMGYGFEKYLSLVWRKLEN